MYIFITTQQETNIRTLSRQKLVNVTVQGTTENLHFVMELILKTICTSRAGEQ
jgi:hypothetical protein